jgi:hypothetical protein
LALFTPEAKCVNARRGKPCYQIALAYQACALAPNFEPMTAGVGCKRDRRGSLALISAKSANMCSQRCDATESCFAFGFSAIEQLCGRPSCQLLELCRPEAQPERGATKGSDWVYYKRSLSAVNYAVLGRNEPPIYVPAGWPQQLGDPIGQLVNPKLVPQPTSSYSQMSKLGVKVDPAIEYECDTSDGKRLNDTINFGGDWPNSCSQICLPTAYLKPAIKRGVIRGRCEDNGCTDFVATRTYMGVPYSTYNCTCPTTNESALYTCPEPDGGGVEPPFNPATDC